MEMAVRSMFAQGPALETPLLSPQGVLNALSSLPTSNSHNEVPA
jgi:hypothetical protein